MVSFRRSASEWTIASGTLFFWLSWMSRCPPSLVSSGIHPVLKVWFYIVKRGIKTHLMRLRYPCQKYSIFCDNQLFVSKVQPTHDSDVQLCKTQFIIPSVLISNSEWMFLDSSVDYSCIGNTVRFWSLLATWSTPALLSSSQETQYRVTVIMGALGAHGNNIKNSCQIK